MSEKILVTGFDRFGYLKKRNASSEVALPAITEKYGNLVDTLILPTSRNLATEKLLLSIKDIDPVTIIMFGISAGKKVRLERQAKNMRLNVITPDNEGVRAIGKINSDGPRNYLATLPLANMYDRLREAKIPTRLSNNAGTFICNEVMYEALHYASESVTSTVVPTGFVHLGSGLSDTLVEEASLLIIDEALRYNSLKDNPGT